jgi:DHA3 family macrolide efflux protein-like MFS transporter
MFTLLAQRDFFLLWVAHNISILGDYVFFIAITFWIYEQTGSALATGLVLISSAIPIILFAPLAGKVVDRWDRRGIMLAAEGARAVLFIGLLGAIIIWPHVLWPIYVVAFLQTALAVFFWPARSALIPQMIEPPSLLAANALYMVSDSSVRIVAPSLGAFALLHLGPAGIVAIDAITFVISAGSVFLLITAPQPQIKVVSTLRTKASSAILPSSERDSSLLRSAGLLLKRELWTHTSIDTNVGGLFFLGSIIAYTAGTLSILLPIFVQTTLAAGPLAYGWMLTAQAIGEGTMSLLMGRISTRRSHWRVIGFVSGCFAVGGLVLILIVHLPILVLSLLLNLVFGLTTAGITVQFLTSLQQRVADRSLGRILAMYTAIEALAKVGGMGVAGVTAAYIGLVWLLAFDGFLYLLGAVLAWVLLRAYPNN